MTEAHPDQVVIFYYRNGCHLCEAMAAVLFKGWPQQAAAMEWRDVDSNPDWLSRFGSRVPVLVLDDDEVCALAPDVVRISEYFGAMADSV